MLVITTTYGEEYILNYKSKFIDTFGETFQNNNGIVIFYEKNYRVGFSKSVAVECDLIRLFN